MQNVQAFPNVSILDFQELRKPTPFVGISHGQHDLQRISNRVCIVKNKTQELGKDGKSIVAVYLDTKEPL